MGIEHVKKFVKQRTACVRILQKAQIAVREKKNKQKKSIKYLNEKLCKRKQPPVESWLST